MSHCRQNNPIIVTHQLDLPWPVPYPRQAPPRMASMRMLASHMSSKHMKSFAGMLWKIGVMPRDVQNAWRVRIAYEMYDQTGRFAPCS